MRVNGLNAAVAVAKQVGNVARIVADHQIRFLVAINVFNGKPNGRVAGVEVADRCEMTVAVAQKNRNIMGASVEHG